MKFFTRFVIAASAAVATNAFTGKATYYNPGVTACNTVQGPQDFIAAVSSKYFEANKETVCNTPITVTYQGKFIKVVIVDECFTCSGSYDLDLSPAAFSALAPLSAGLLNPITWS